MAAIIKTDQLWLDQTTSSAVGAPALIFGADSLSGLYRIGTNNIGLAINGTKLLDLSSATFAVTGAVTISGTLGVTGTITPGQTTGIVGTTTNNNAQAGSVGEYIESVIASGSSVSLTTSVMVNMTSISLTAGDQDVTAIIKGNTAGSATISWVRCSISTTSATYNDAASFANESTQATNNIGAPAFGIPPYRISIAGTTTVYATIQMAFAVGTVGAYGRLSARRVR